MSPENLDINSITAARRKAVESSIRPIAVEEVKSLQEEIFPYFDDPWRERFIDFMRENSGCLFYHATTNDPVQILYCPSKDQGIWFRPGSGVGVLQPNGLQILKEIVEKSSAHA